MPEDASSPEKITLKRITLDPARWSRVLRERRVEKGLTIRQVSERSGVSSSTVHRMEQGFYLIQLDKFLRILDVLDLEPADVLTIDGRETTPPPSDHEKKILEALRAKDSAGLLQLLGKYLGQEKL